MAFTMSVIRWMLHRKFRSSRQPFMTSIGCSPTRRIWACVLLPPPLPSLEPTPSNSTRTNQCDLLGCSVSGTWQEQGKLSGTGAGGTVEKPQPLSYAGDLESAHFCVLTKRRIALFGR
jgi:hypothetical protein